MSATFLVVPQWQGSGSARAMRLVDGTDHIRGDLPSSSTTVVEVPPGAGSDLGTSVHRLSAVQRVRDEVRAVLHDTRSSSADPVVLVGGDCGAVLAGVEHANRGDDLAVLWFDAHGDLNTPDSSPSGAFNGMVLRTLLGDGPDVVAPSVPLRPERVVLVGARALDEGESAYLDGSPVRLLPADADAAAVAAAVTATDAGGLWVHVDLDVLDPAEFTGVGEPEPFGMTVAGLVDAIGAARRERPLVGASLTGFAPASAQVASDDMPAVLRIVGALTRPVASTSGAR